MMTLNTLITEQLAPHVIDIDEGTYYAQPFIQQLFAQGYFKEQDIVGNAEVIEQVSETCLTTGFCLWCQLAFSTYLQYAPQTTLFKTLQQQLLSGEILGATGLSNPMKSFNDLEQFNLEHHYVNGQLVVSGVMPAVSNIQQDHYFGAISKAKDTDELVMFIVRANQEHITLVEKSNFLGVNGSATYQINLDHVTIPKDQIVTKDAKTFASAIRPQFVALQIPIALGSIRSSLDLIHQFAHTQNGINQYLEYDIDFYEEKHRRLKDSFYDVIKAGQLDEQFSELIHLKKEAGYLLLDVNQASMVNGGARAYSPRAPQARKLKEGFFFAALTPTLRHLGKLQEEIAASTT
ncbi:acyl-CoA dehydrogenase family protein [Staphylococcus simiae]|nr:acyl-CoA dehydrogenase [Staphylococcus simiae]